MKKKILSLLLIALLVCTLLPTTSLAVNDTVEDVRTFSFAAGVTTQDDINSILGEGTVECTSEEVDGQTVYTLKLLKNIVMAPGCDFRINEYNVGGMSLPPVILDLHGCTITSQSIGLITGGKLTITDTAGNGGITYSTTSDKSSLVTISNTGELTILSGTFTCESGYAFAGYVAAVSTQGVGATTQIYSGMFISNSSAVLSSNGGVTTVSGGLFQAPYGLYAKSGTSGRGEIIVPSSSTAMVDADNFALVTQRVNGTDGKITVEGGTFLSPNAVGGVGSPDTAEAVSIEGGTYQTDPQSWVSDDVPVAQLTQSGTVGQYLVGQDVITKASSYLKDGDEITVLTGSFEIGDLSDGVTVSNKGDGQVVANGETVTDTPVTTHTHVWGKPVFTWGEDNTASATFTCEKDSNHQKTIPATVTSAVKNASTCTNKGVTEYTATVEFYGTKYTDTKEVVDIPTTVHSYEDGHCTVCGAIDSSFKPLITAGANSTWQIGTKVGLSFTSNAAFGDFQKVQVDGKDLDASNYTVKEGSTIVTLKAEYLGTLSAGTHTLAIVSETGTATTEFTIKAAPASDDTQSPQTGDNSNMMLWIALLFVSGGALFTMLFINKKKSVNNR